MNPVIFCLVLVFSGCAAIDGFKQFTNTSEERSLDYVRERELMDKVSMEKTRCN